MEKRNKYYVFKNVYYRLLAKGRTEKGKIIYLLEDLSEISNLEKSANPKLPLAVDKNELTKFEVKSYTPRGSKGNLNSLIEPLKRIVENITGLEEGITDTIAFMETSKRAMVFPRQIIIYCLVEIGGLSYQEIANIFKRSNKTKHTIATYSHGRIKDRLSVGDPDVVYVLAIVAEILNQLGHTKLYLGLQESNPKIFLRDGVISYLEAYKAAQMEKSGSSINQQIIMA
jgi:hypothetical protein